jgi:inositol transport system ATP-binding protein
VALEARNLTRHGVFENISFQVRKGEIFGLAGLVGAGRTEVARVIFGLDPADSGEILIDGKPVRIRNTTDAIHNGIAMVSEDRKNEGLVLIRSVWKISRWLICIRLRLGSSSIERVKKYSQKKMKEKLRIKLRICRYRQHPERWQPAEGRHRQMADRRTEGSDP